MPGSVARFAFAPSTPSGHYKRKLKSALGTEPKDDILYGLPIPGHRRRDLGRTAHEVPAQPPHEAMAKDMEKSPSLAADLEALKARGGLPPPRW